MCHIMLKVAWFRQSDGVRVARGTVVNNAVVLLTPLDLHYCGRPYGSKNDTLLSADLLLPGQ